MRPAYEYASVKVIGTIIILGVLGAFVVTITVLGVGLLTVGGVKVPQVAVLQDLQRYFYLTSNRNIWQFIDECAVPDDALVYVPAPGDCNFSNMEFETTLTFDQHRRLHQPTATTDHPGIAVLGDSHAMGWGVENDETFSAHLERLTGRTVLNFGVSSYATEREMMRLVTSPFSDTVDTIVIQYCDNDLNANRKYPIRMEIARKHFSIAKRNYEPFSLSRLAGSFFGAFPVLTQHVNDRAGPFLAGALPGPVAGSERSPWANPPQPSGDHVASVLRVLDGYAQYLSDKRIIVFYSNAHGSDRSMGEWAGTVERPAYTVEFVDLDLNGNDHYFEIDDHLNADGHREVAFQLHELLGDKPEEGENFLSAGR